MLVEKYRIDLLKQIKNHESSNERDFEKVRNQMEDMKVAFENLERSTRVNSTEALKPSEVKQMIHTAGEKQTHWIESKFREHKDEIDQLAQAIADLRSDLDKKASKEETQFLGGEMDRQRKELNQKMKKQKDLIQEDIDAMSSRVQKATERIDDHTLKYDDKINELERSIEKASTEIDTSIQGFQDRLREQSRRNAEMVNDAKKEIDHHNDNNRENIGDMTARMNQLDNQRKSDIEDLITDMDNLRRHVDNVESTGNSNSDFETHIRRIEVRVQQAEADIGQTRSENASRQSKYEQHLGTVENKVFELENDLARIVQDMKKLDDNNLIDADHIKRLDKKDKTLQAAIDDLQAKISAIDNIDEV